MSKRGCIDTPKTKLSQLFDAIRAIIPFFPASDTLDNCSFYAYYGGNLIINYQPFGMASSSEL